MSWSWQIISTSAGIVLICSPCYSANSPPSLIFQKLAEKSGASNLKYYLSTFKVGVPTIFRGRRCGIATAASVPQLQKDKRGVQSKNGWISSEPAKRKAMEHGV